MTMALIDFTMSPDLIRGWIKKVRPFLKSEDKGKQEFEDKVKQVYREAQKRDGKDIEEDEMSVN